jgi:RHS repeat-associated protein
MQPALRSPLPDASLAVFPVNGEKPHQGVWRRKTAPYRVRHRCNLRNALGLRAGQHRNRVRSRCSGEQYDPDLGLYYLRARYYNPLTGRFMSRDPEDGKLTDPKSLHKYLYADGDPVNVIDPRGQSSTADYVLTAVIVAAVVEAPMHYWWIPDYGCTKMGQSATGVLIASPLFSPAGAMFAWIYGVLVGLNCWNY